MNNILVIYTKGGTRFTGTKLTSTNGGAGYELERPGNPAAYLNQDDIRSVEPFQVPWETVGTKPLTPDEVYKSKVKIHEATVRATNELLMKAELTVTGELVIYETDVFKLIASLTGVDFRNIRAQPEEDFLTLQSSLVKPTFEAAGWKVTYVSLGEDSHWIFVRPEQAIQSPVGGQIKSSRDPDY